VTGSLRIFLAVILLELVAGSVYLIRIRSASTPPTPDFSGFPVVIQTRLVPLIEGCRANVASDWNGLAETFFAVGFGGEAEACHQRGSELEPDVSLWRYNLAFCRAARGRTALAEKDFRAVLEMDPSRTASCWYFIGTIALRENRVEDAKRAFEKSGSLAAAKIILANLAVRNGNLAIAQEILNGLRETHPKTRIVQHLLSSVNFANGNERNGLLHQLKADVFSGIIRGPWNERADQLQEISRECGVSSQVKLGFTLLEIGDVAAAEQLVETANRHLWDPSLEDFLADVDYVKGHAAERLQHLKTVIEKDGADSHRLARLGSAQLSQGNHDAALQSMITGVHLLTDVDGRESIDMCLQHSQLLTTTGDAPKAKKIAAKAAFMEGMGLMESGKHGEAIEWFQRSAKRDERSARTWFWLGNVLQLAAQTAASVAAYDECLARDPYHERARQWRKLAIDSMPGR